MPESGTEDEKEWLRLWRVRRVRGGGASGAVNSMGDSSRAHWLAPSFVVDSHGKFDIRQIRSNGSSEDKEKAGAGGGGQAARGAHAEAWERQDAEAAAALHCARLALCVCKLGAR